MYVSPQISSAEALIRNRMVFGDGTFGRQMCHEGESVTIEISAFI